MIVIPLNYARSGSIAVQAGKCSLCRRDDVQCLVIDGSEGEYGEILCCRACVDICFDQEQEPLSALREKAAIYDEAWQALPAWVTDACEPDHCGDLPYAIGLLAEKARLWDALAAAIARDDSSDWEVYRGSENPVVIYLRGTGEMVGGATLAEAVTKAMESEEK
jgi:hypothetical protein